MRMLMVIIIISTAILLLLTRNYLEDQSESAMRTFADLYFKSCFPTKEDCLDGLMYDMIKSTSSCIAVSKH
jgi:hypothetical protein